MGCCVQNTIPAGHIRKWADKDKCFINLGKFRTHWVFLRGPVLKMGRESHACQIARRIWVDQYFYFLHASQLVKGDMFTFITSSRPFLFTDEAARQVFEMAVQLFATCKLQIPHQKNMDEYGPSSWSGRGFVVPNMIILSDPWSFKLSDFPGHVRFAARKIDQCSP